MSGIKYNPNPARVWSRVQNRCSTDTADSTVDYARIDYDRQMLLKGNILQYKKNSSNLTKNQRYTQIAKGMWTNRTKTWATQSDTYTNPNNSSLLRVNYTILDSSNNTFSSPSNPFNCPTNEIQDGGNLVCNVVVNPCTQEVIKRSVSQQLCNPTTDSDVPGQIQQLCWNDGTQTWYPRQRYTMGNSGTSWPEGYKGFVSALTLEAPVLTLDSSNNNSITLSWTAISNDCMPISSFNIYQNGILIGNVLYPIHTITISNLCGSYSFYVKSLSNDIESGPSNIVSYSNATDAPILSLSYINPNSIYLSWTPVSNAVLYNIYQIGVGLIDTTTSTNITISIECGFYSYYVTALNNGCESESSDPVSYTNIINAPTGLSFSATSTVNQINLSWSSVSNATYYNIYKNGIFDQSSNTINSLISNLYGTNTFTVTACISSNSCESSQSNLITVTQYTTTGSTLTSGKNISFLSSGSTITFNYTTNIKYILVGGGGSGGYHASAVDGLAAGGGGHIMKSTSNNTMSNGNILTFTIGQGGIAPTSTTPSGNGNIGGDTFITGTISKSTSNSTYGGRGGEGELNVAWQGGIADVGTANSAAGGSYTLYTSNNNNGTGGASGSLTNETPTLSQKGNIGGSNSANAAGKGGDSIVDVDGNYYGGGGGGGGIAGTGGSGGGGTGATTTSSAAPGGDNTGGGGGGGYYVSSSKIYLPANGGSGRVIIMIQ